MMVNELKLFDDGDNYNNDNINNKINTNNKITMITLIINVIIYSVIILLLIFNHGYQHCNATHNIIMINM